MFIVRLVAPLFNYIEKELFKTLGTIGPSGTAPVNNDALDAAVAEQEEARRKMLATERQAQIAEERARQTRHHQYQMRAA